MRDVADNFPLLGTMVDAKRYGSGHINDTFVANFARPGGGYATSSSATDAIFPNPAGIVMSFEPHPVPLLSH